MVRLNYVDYVVAGMFFIFGSLLVYFNRDLISLELWWTLILLIACIFSVALLIGGKFSLRLTRGKPLETDQLKDGEYWCRRSGHGLFWIKPKSAGLGSEYNFVFRFRLPFDIGPPLDRQPREDFTLKVSTERGRRGEKGKRFSRRLYLAVWEDKEKVQKLSWTSDDRPA